MLYAYPQFAVLMFSASSVFQSCASNVHDRIPIDMGCHFKRYLLHLPVCKSYAMAPNVWGVAPGFRFVTITCGHAFLKCRKGERNLNFP